MNESTPGTAPPDRTRRLLLAALGVVFGDIGTSPLYAIRECFSHGGGALEVSPASILGGPEPRGILLARHGRARVGGL